MSMFDSPGLSEDSSHCEIFLFAAPDIPALLKAATTLATFLSQAPDARLKDVSYTCCEIFRESTAHEAVLALVAASTDELRQRLATAIKRISEGTASLRDKSGSYFYRTHLVGPGTEGRLACVFPGAASFYPDMLRDVVIRFPACRTAFDELEEALAAANPRFVPSVYVFPPASYYRHDADVLSAGGYAEAMVAVYSANAALYRLFTELHLASDGFVGFAGGDLSALAQGGALGDFPRQDRLGFLQAMYRVVGDGLARSGLPACEMFSVFATNLDNILVALSSFDASKVTVTLLQSPRLLTVAVLPQASAAVQAALTDAGARLIRLPVDRPFNTPWCANLLPQFRKFAAQWVHKEPRIPLYAAATADRFPERPRRIREVAAEQWTKPVRFVETINRMYEEGFRVFLEVGPRGMAAAAVDEILKRRPALSIAADSMHRPGSVQLLNAIAQLAAAGAALNPAALFEGRRVRKLDFTAPLFLEIKADRAVSLTRTFPQLLIPNSLPTADSPRETPEGGGKARLRKAAIAARHRRQRQFENGPNMPLVSDAEIIHEALGESAERLKTFDLNKEPFVADYALGAAGISYSDDHLRGLIPLPFVVGAEAMAEVAQALVPTRRLDAVNDLVSRRMLSFEKERLTVRIRADRIRVSNPTKAAFKVSLWQDAPEATLMRPAMEATFIFATGDLPFAAYAPAPLPRPRSVHWKVRDIYPGRLIAGESLRNIRTAENWSEGGLDYEVTLPPMDALVAHTRVPVWILPPTLLSAITDGFALWRSHERFTGAVSMPFRVRHVVPHIARFQEGMRFRCYLRLKGVTPYSHMVDIAVTDGNGNLALELLGYEEITARVPPSFRQLLLAPATAYFSEALPLNRLGSPLTPVAASVIRNIPYDIFARNEELWLKIVSQIVLDADERQAFAEMAGDAHRRTEFLMGRIAAKETLRRYLDANYQARWAAADVKIWADDNGKPFALGAWQDFLSARVDLAISHTQDFAVAVVAANARVGVDVENESRHLTEEFTRGVFSPEEIALATASANAHASLVRFWCAKETVSKALGLGIRYAPRELVITEFQADEGKITLSLTGAWLENFKSFRARPIVVSSVVVESHILTSCFIPDSLFN